MNSNVLVLPILLPLLSALALVFTRRFYKLTRFIENITMISTTIISLWLLIYVMIEGPIVLNFGGWVAPYGIQFVGDELSMLLVTTASFVVTFVLYFGYGRGEKRANRYYLPTFILFMTVGVIGSFLTADVFNLYVMFEIMLIASFVLITLGQSIEQLRASIIYVVLNIIGSWLFLISIGLIYRTFGTLNFTHIAERANELQDTSSLVIISMMFIVAFGSKAALVLFMWLPKAYAVLNTELAALFAALMTKVGAYALIRFFTLILDEEPGITHPLLVTMACVTMVIGAVGVLAYRDIKKIAAYQVVLSIGFIILGLGTHTHAGVSGAIFYLTNDMIVKTLLFFVVGIIVYISGYRQYKYLHGLARKEPFLGVTFFILILAIGGVPPFSGFPGKLLIFQGAVESGHYFALGLMLVTSLIAMYSLFRVCFTMYFGNALKGETVNFKPIAKHRKNILAVFVAVIIAMGLAAPWILKVTDRATEVNMNDAIYMKHVNPELKEEIK